MIYPKGGHGLKEQAGDRNRRIFEWFEKYIPTPPTATPTSVPAAEAPEEPGFGGVFAIAGLLAVAYLLRRK